MDMAKTYNPSEFEKDIYTEWEQNGYFIISETLYLLKDKSGS